MKRFSDTLEKVLLGIGGCILVASALLMSSEVVRRYLVGSSILWAEEVITIFMVYSSFIVSGAVLKQGSHVKMSIVYEHMAERVRRWALIIISTVGTIMSAFLFWSGVLLIKFLIESGIHPYTATGLDPWVIALGFPIGMVFLTFYFALQLYTVLTGGEVAGYEV